MPELTVTLDDNTTARLADCDWVFYRRCGCPFGCMTAQTSIYTAYDEDTAWREFYDEGTKRETEKRIRKALAEGVKAELMTLERWRREISPKMRLSYKCPHIVQLELPTVAAESGGA